MEEVAVYVGMGANEGDRAGALRAAVAALDATDGVRVERASVVYEAEAHRLPGQAPQPDHLNAVLRLRTPLAPDALLDVFRALETVAGRAPDAPRWGTRPLDLDLLLYADLVLASPHLVVPHPRLAERRFVLRPLADLAPDLIVPGLDVAVSDLLAVCPDPARVEPTALLLR